MGREEIGFLSCSRFMRVSFFFKDIFLLVWMDGWMGILCTKRGGVGDAVRTFLFFLGGFFLILEAGYMGRSECLGLRWLQIGCRDGWGGGEENCIMPSLLVGVNIETAMAGTTCLLLLGAMRASREGMARS